MNLEQMEKQVSQRGLYLFDHVPFEVSFKIRMGIV